MPKQTTTSTRTAGAVLGLCCALTASCAVPSIPPLAGSEDTSSTSTTTPVGPSFRELHPQVLALIKKATTARAQGIITHGSERVRISLTGTTDGKAVEYTVHDKEGKLTTLKVNQSYWVRASEQYWKATLGKNAALVKDQWVALQKVPVEGVPTLVSLLADTIALPFTPGEMDAMTPTKGVWKKRPTLTYSLPDGSRSLTVFATGDPWPLRYRERDVGATAVAAPPTSASTSATADPTVVTDLTWGSWSSVPAPAAPPAKEVAKRPEPS